MDGPQQKPLLSVALPLGLSWGGSFGKFPRLGKIISLKMTPILHSPSSGGGDVRWVCKGTEVFLFAICTESFCSVVIDPCYLNLQIKKD